MAASDAKRQIKRAPYRMYGRIISSSGLNPITGGLTVLAATVDLDGAGYNATTNSPAEIGTTGFFSLDLTAAEMTADHIGLNVTATNANAVKFLVDILPEAAADSGVLAAVPSSTSVTLPSTASATAGYYVGLQLEIVRGTGAGQVRTITAFSTGRVATLDRAWATNPDTSSVYLIKPFQQGSYDTAGVQKVNATQVNSDSAAATNLQKLYTGGVIPDTVNDVGATTTAFKGGGTATLSSTDDFYKNSLVVFESGALAGLAARVSSYVGSTKQFVLSVALPSAPANSVAFCVLAHQE